MDRSERFELMLRRSRQLGGRPGLPRRRVPATVRRTPRANLSIWFEAAVLTESLLCKERLRAFWGTWRPFLFRAATKIERRYGAGRTVALRIPWPSTRV